MRHSQVDLLVSQLMSLLMRLLVCPLVRLLMSLLVSLKRWRCAAFTATSQAAYVPTRAHVRARTRTREVLLMPLMS